MSSFASRVRELRSTKGLTQKQLASEFEVSEVLWRKYEGGTRTPTFEGLIAIADFFDVSLDYLVGRSDFAFLIPYVNHEGITEEDAQWIEARIEEAKSQGYIFPKVGVGVDVFKHMMALLIQNAPRVRDLQRVLDCVEAMEQAVGSPEFFKLFFEFIRLTKEVSPLVMPLLVKLSRST